MENWIVLINHIYEQFRQQNCSHVEINPFQIWKTILNFFAVLFIQLWNFRVFLFLTFFAKSNNKVTRRDYVNWGTIVEINPNTQITRFDGTTLAVENIPKACWRTGPRFKFRCTFLRGLFSLNKKIYIFLHTALWLSILVRYYR